MGNGKYKSIIMDIYDEFNERLKILDIEIENLNSIPKHNGHGDFSKEINLKTSTYLNIRVKNREIILDLIKFIEFHAPFLERGFK